MQGKKITEMMLNEIKDQIIQRAQKDEQLVQVVKGKDISKEAFSDALAYVEDYLNAVEICKQCKSLDDCKMQVKGMMPFLKVVNKNLVQTTKQCSYFTAVNSDYINSSKYVKRYFGNELLKAKLSELDMSTKDRVNLVNKMISFIENYPLNKKGLFVHGAPGVGKTHTMAAFTNKLIEKNVKVASVFVPDFIADVKGLAREYDAKEELLNSVKKAQVLVMDDIGAERIDSWGRDEILLPLINYRSENGLPTFFTSNYSPAELKARYGEDGNVIAAIRLCERVGMLTDPIELLGDSRR